MGPVKSFLHQWRITRAVWLEVDRTVRNRLLSLCGCACCSHRPYREWGTSEWRKVLVKLAVVVDFKGIVPREIINQLGVSLWRL